MLPGHMMQLRQLNKRLTTGKVGKKMKGGEETWLAASYPRTSPHVQSAPPFSKV